MERQQLIEEQKKLEEKLDKVREKLLKIPNVVAVAIGVKETKYKMTQELCYRVYVTQKKPLKDLKESEKIPEEIEGVKTDVLNPIKISDELDVCGDERLTLSKKRPLQAGIAISTNSTSAGTLGWFGKLDADDTWIVLTNKHVVYDESCESKTDNLKLAQPQLGRKSKCCCCECGSDNVVGEVLIGIKNTCAASADAAVDCAIAKIGPEFTSGLNLAITNDATSQSLTVSGTSSAVAMETVRKIGVRSGFTKGVVLQVGDIAVSTSGTPIVLHAQVLIKPHDDETYEVRVSGNCVPAFSNNGDSGSVILNDDDEIVALLYARGDPPADNSYKSTLACDISSVLTALTNAGFPITLSTSPGGGESAIVSAATSNWQQNVQKAVPLNSLEILRDQNKESLLYELYEKHFEEVLDLVNHCRPVTVAWQRNQGPAFVAAINRASRVEQYEIPHVINESSREILLESMSDALIEHGSEALKEDIIKHGKALIQCVVDRNSISDIAEALFIASYLDQMPTDFQPIME